MNPKILVIALADIATAATITGVLFLAGIGALHLLGLLH